MKTPLCTSILALLGSAVFAAEPDSKPSKPDTKPPVSVTSKATITIDVNGKKETREVDLWNATPFKVQADGGTVKSDGAPAKAPAAQRTWLGVATDEPSDEVRAQLPIPNGTGLVIDSVVAESPAAQAGFEKNDVLVRLDDQILTNPDQLRKLVGLKKDGDIVRVTYLRKGREASAEVKLGTHAESEGTGDVQWKVGSLIGKGVASEIQAALKPLILGSTYIVDKDGKWVPLQDSADAGKGRVAEQWWILASQAKVDLAEATKQLEKSLRDAGVKEQGINEVKKALADAAAQLRKAAIDLGTDKAGLQRDLQKAAEEIRRSVEQVWRAEAEAALKSNPAPSAPPAQKAP